MKKILCALLLALMSCSITYNVYTSSDVVIEQSIDSDNVSYDEDDIFSYPVDVDEFDEEMSKRVPLTDTQVMLQRVGIKVALGLLYCKYYCVTALDYILNNKFVNYIVHGAKVLESGNEVAS